MRQSSKSAEVQLSPVAVPFAIRHSSFVIPVSSTRFENGIDLQDVKYLIKPAPPNMSLASPPLPQ